MEPSPFKQAIKEHLVLREKNTALEAAMPLARYRSEEIAANHSIFKSETDAVSEETQRARDRSGRPTRGWS